MSVENQQSDSTDSDTPDQLDTDTVGRLQLGTVLDVDGTTAYVAGTWVPPILALPEVRCITADGYRKLVVSDTNVAFRDEYDEDDEAWADEDKTSVENVSVSDGDRTAMLALARDVLPETDSRASPIHPEGNVGHFVGGWRSNGRIVEFYRDQGYDTLIDGEKDREYYGEETLYVWVRDDPDTSPASVPTRTFGHGDDDPVTAEGLYRREDSGQIGALCGANGKQGWYTAEEVADYARKKVGGDSDPHGYVSEKYAGKIEWHDRGRQAVLTFTPV
jgi:hypothetical protein